MDKIKDESKRLPEIYTLNIREEDLPTILRVCGGERDPNLKDVPHRDIPKYLREQFWIKQWSPSD